MLGRCARTGRYTPSPAVAPAQRQFEGKNRIAWPSAAAKHSSGSSDDMVPASSWIGLGCLFAFAASQGVRDVFFGNVFQSISFMCVAALAFGTATAAFLGAVALRRPRAITKLLGSPAELVALNGTTAAAWLSFFFSLQYLEPAVVATLYNGAGPLSALLLQRAGMTSTQTRSSRLEVGCYVGIAAALAAMIALVLTGRSGTPATDRLMQAGALAAALLGGAVITLSHAIARWFNDQGVGADAVMGARFLLALLVAAATETGFGTAASWPEDGTQLAVLAATAFALITLPSYLLQIGIAHTSPLAVNVFRSLGPVFVFAVQQLDGRLRFSGATLACVAAFCGFATTSAALRTRSEIVTARA